MKLSHLLGTAALAAVLVAPVTARAEIVEGWYVGVGAMMPFEIDADSTLSGVANQIEYKTGWGVSASGGYAWGNGLRTELEYAYRHSAVKEVRGTGSAAVDGGGIHNKAFMANALYDINLGTLLTPYVGGGVGVSIVDADNIFSVNGANLDGDKAALAYQAIAGAALQLEGNWAFTADYRYFATQDVKFKTSTGVKAETENASHNLIMGVRYTFAKPPAPPAPAPEVKAVPKAPAPVAPKAAAPVLAPMPQSYMVFFDFDKSVLTPEAQRIVSSAAADFKKGKYVRLVVTGHTDTSGPTVYNQALSMRRADAVKKAFADLGIPESEIAVSASGETELLVPTTDGVREAQNRRAEIVLKK